MILLITRLLTNQSLDKNIDLKKIFFWKKQKQKKNYLL